MTPADVTAIVGVLALLCALAALAVNAANRRDSVTNSQMQPFKQDVERALVSSAGAAAHAARNSEELKNLEIRLLRDLHDHQEKMVGLMDKMLEDRLDPLTKHVLKTEAFMVEAFRSGVFSNRRAGD